MAYRILSMIPTVATIPGTDAPKSADPEHVTLAINTAMQLPADMDRHSAGMCEIDGSLLVLSEPLPPAVFATSSSRHFVGPVELATYLGVFDEYDGFFVYNPADLTTVTTFRGLGGSSTKTPWSWIKVGTGDEPEIAVHEFGHAMTAYLSVARGEYTNFPVCGGEPAMHCAHAYGFRSDLDPPWFEGFFQGTLPDGSGINEDGWSVQTPTEAGEKSLPTAREFSTPWGELGTFPIEAGPGS